MLGAELTEHLGLSLTPARTNLQSNTGLAMATIAQDVEGPMMGRCLDDVPANRDWQF